jgi:hypothetical protein
MVDFSFGFFGGRDRSANGWQRSEEEFFFKGRFSEAAFLQRC